MNIGLLKTTFIILYFKKRNKSHDKTNIFMGQLDDAVSIVAAVIIVSTVAFVQVLYY